MNVYQKWRERGKRATTKKRIDSNIDIDLWWFFDGGFFFQLFASCSDFNFFPSALFLFWFLQIWLTITFKLYKKKRPTNLSAVHFFFISLFRSSTIWHHITWKWVGLPITRLAKRIYHAEMTLVERSAVRKTCGKIRDVNRTAQNKQTEYLYANSTYALARIL